LHKGRNKPESLKLKESAQTAFTAFSNQFKEYPFKNLNQKTVTQTVKNMHVYI
jgi:hypothetical protein